MWNWQFVSIEYRDEEQVECDLNFLVPIQRSGYAHNTILAILYIQDIILLDGNLNTTIKDIIG
jgi:hypothetical protein